jgi:hypothetical protein
LKIIEKLIAPLVWIFIVAEGIQGGIMFPTADIGQNISEMLSIEMKLTFIAFSFVAFTVMWPFVMSYNKSSTWVKRPIESIFSEGAYERIGSSLRFDLLIVVFTVLIGVIGIVRCYLIGAPEINFYFCIFVLSGGLGVLCGMTIYKYWE